MSGYLNSAGQLKSLKVTQTLSGSATLSQSDTGKYFYCTGLFSTISLPNPSTINDGWHVILKVSPGVILTVDAGAGTINSHATISLTPDATIEIVYSAATSFTATFVSGMTRAHEIYWGATEIIDGNPNLLRTKLNQFVGTLNFVDGDTAFLQFPLPSNLVLSTSYGFTVYYMPNNTNAGNFDWDLRYQYLDIGNVLTTYESAASLTETRSSSAVINQLETVEFSIPSPAASSGILILALTNTSSPIATNPLVVGCKLHYISYEYNFT